MSKKPDGGEPMTGNFIFGRKIINDGQIISEGKRPMNYVQTDQYSGKGLIRSKQIDIVKEELYQKWWVKLSFVIIGGLIVAYFSFRFGWTK